ncbi:hypothetical protein RFI_26076 [Reticulomyxa filosa]|uniref:Uncharacterized protein n=1 Tax=Reticulomyxa filosa TaxID=46433 RepID=X6ME32_RETFI|nr:hypothetical protein RFI_26076 [Reticulomyxa filosa]|eukprot:ETO11300.1 hypothetical protein RFI_26076 [Reticulomyxa filosa]
MDPNAAATKIQKVVRGFLVRKKVEQMIQVELNFLDMACPLQSTLYMTKTDVEPTQIKDGGPSNDMFLSQIPSKINDKEIESNPIQKEENNINKIHDNQHYPVFYDLSLPFVQIDKNCTQNPQEPPQVVILPNAKAKQQHVRQERVNMRIENQIQYMRSIATVRKEVILEEEHKIRENSRQERFQWAIQYRESQGAYPTSFEGFYAEKEAAKNPIKKIPEEELEESSKTKQKKPTSKQANSKNGTTKKKNNEKEQEENNGDNIYITTPDIVKNELKLAIQQYAKKIEKSKQCERWENVDEKENPTQTHNVPLLKQQLLPSVVREIEQDVDKQLLETLENLQKQLNDTDDKQDKKIKKTKKGKKSKKKTKSS